MVASAISLRMPKPFKTLPKPVASPLATGKAGRRRKLFSYAQRGQYAVWVVCAGLSPMVVLGMVWWLGTSLPALIGAGLMCAIWVLVCWFLWDSTRWRVTLHSDGLVTRHGASIGDQRQVQTMRVENIGYIASYDLETQKHSTHCVVLVPRTSSATGHLRETTYLHLSRMSPGATFLGKRIESAASRYLRVRFAKISGCEDQGYLGPQYVSDAGTLQPREGGRSFPKPTPLPVSRRRARS